MGKDYLSVAKEGLMMFMCASVGIYFMVATVIGLKNEIKKEEPVSLDMYRHAFDEEN
jgi:hypothetical protein